jgi:hypothetical protein
VRRVSHLSSPIWRHRCSRSHNGYSFLGVTAPARSSRQNLSILLAGSLIAAAEYTRWNGDYLQPWRNPLPSPTSSLTIIEMIPLAVRREEMQHTAAPLCRLVGSTISQTMVPAWIQNESNWFHRLALSTLVALSIIGGHWPRVAEVLSVDCIRRQPGGYQGVPYLNRPTRSNRITSSGVGMPPPQPRGD